MGGQGQKLCLLLAVAALAGCRHHHPRAHKVFTPPPVRQHHIIRPAAPVVREPMPHLAPQPVASLPPPPFAPSALGLPPTVPQPPVRRRPGPPSRPKPAAEPAAQQQAPSQAPAVTLVPLLSPAQRAENMRALDASVRQARQVLARARQRRLDANQRVTVERIQSFLQQAESLRASDPAAARDMAGRAATLAAELSKHW